MARAYLVAPYVGAWIETSVDFKLIFQLKSHPTWVRGLKHTYQCLLEGSD